MKNSEQNNPFSYAEYREILKQYKQRIQSFKSKAGVNFVIIRHDVEFNIEKALMMADLENEMGVKSSYFFQVRSPAYNILAYKNLKMINAIKDLGHEIGLHFYVKNIKENDWERLEQELEVQKQIFEFATKKMCYQFSFHRPKSWLLKRRDNHINGLINAYGQKYFEYSTEPKNIKYFADSRHRWDYGNPLSENNFEKIQILTHPDEWSEEGLNEANNFRQLQSLHSKAFLECLDEETVNFNSHKEPRSENLHFWK